MWCIINEVLKQARMPQWNFTNKYYYLSSCIWIYSPFVKDFKRDLSAILTYETALFNFLTEGSLYQLYKPIFELYYLADKEDFNFNKNPLLFCLKYFNATFFIAHNQ